MEIRKRLTEGQFIECIIQCPENMFFGTSVSVTLAVFSKGPKDGILMINASKEFKKIPNQCIMEEHHINRVAGAYNDFLNGRFVPVEGFSAFVKNEELESNGFDLSVHNYVREEEKPEVIDIDAVNAECDELMKQINEIDSRIKELLKK